MSQFKFESVKYSDDDDIEMMDSDYIETSSFAHRLKKNITDALNPHSLDAISEKIAETVGDPKDKRTFANRMKDEILSRLQSNTQEHNIFRAEVDFGGDFTQYLQQFTKKGNDMITILDRDIEELKKERDMFAKIDMARMTDSERARYAELNHVIDNKERLYVNRGTNNVTFRTSPKIGYVNVKDNGEGGVFKKTELDEAHEEIQCHFYNEIEDVEINAKRKMVEKICEKTGLDKELFIIGTYKTPFVEKDVPLEEIPDRPLYNKKLIDEFVKLERPVPEEGFSKEAEDYMFKNLEEPSLDQYELSSILSIKGKTIEIGITDEQRKRAEESERIVKDFLGKDRPDRIIDRIYPNYATMSPFTGKSEETAHLTATMDLDVEMCINGRYVPSENLDYAMEQVTRTGDFSRGLSHKASKFALKQGVRGASFRMAGYPVEMAEKALKAPGRQIEQGNSILVNILQQVMGTMSRGVQVR